MKPIILKAASSPVGFVISSSNPDRVGDRVRSILPVGDLPALRNHNPDHVVGSFSGLEQRDGQWLMQFNPLEAGTSTEGDVTRKLLEQRIPMSASIGGIPGRIEPNDMGGYDLFDVELMEVSIAPVPMNADSRALYKSIDTQGIYQMTAENNPPADLHKVGDAAPAIHTKQHRLPDVGDVIRIQLDKQRFDGLPREIHDELCNQSPNAVTKGVRYPLAWITKANSALSGGSHANVTDDTWLIEAMRFTSNAIPNESTIGQLGLTYVTANDINAKIPTVTDRPLAVVKTLDADLTADDSAMTALDVPALKWGALSTVNHSMLYTVGNTGIEVLRRQMANAVMDKLELVVIGPASGDEPNGLLDDATEASTGSNNIADTETAWRAFRKEITSYLNVSPNSGIVKFFVPQTIVDVLAITPRFTNAQSGIIQDLDGMPMLAGTPVVASQGAFDETTPAQTPVLCGDFSALTVVVFNNGSSDVVVNPWGSSFASGGFQVRVLTDMSIKLSDTSAVLQAVSDQS